MTARPHAIALVALSLLATTGCASSHRPATYGDGLPYQASSFTSAAADRNVSSVSWSQLLSAEELSAEPSATNLHAALMRLRPRFLQVRGSSSPVIGGSPVGAQGARNITVFVNGSYMGGVEVLQTITVQDVLRVRHYHQVESAHRFGSQAPYGALEITLVRR